MTKRYLIKLTPYSNFFFGGEKTFGQDNKANYLVRSNNFPQQTALLGLVRYQLLRESPFFNKATNKIRSSEKSKVQVPSLIGAHSFDLAKPFEFGKIDSVSPMFIVRDTEGEFSYFFRTNKEYQTDPETDETKLVEIARLKGPNAHIFHLEGYDQKLGLQTFFESRTSDVLLKPEDIFADERQTGIRKNYNGQTEDNAYYIQFFKRFRSTSSCRYSFAFILKLDESVDPEVFNQEFVVLGAEQRTFRMECEEYSKEFRDILPDFRASQNMSKVVLVSDAYVGDKDLIGASDFAISDTVDFRFLKTSVNETKNYADLNRSGKKNSEKVSKSKKFNLYAKGSVFYADDTSKIEEILSDQAFRNFRKLGYNHFEVINKK